MEQTIPLFACKSLDGVLDFYQTLGFEVTHRQTQPYIYGAIRRGAVEIHFNSLTVWKSKNAVCLVMVEDVASYHQIFADALRTKYGKIPTTGVPRITRLRKTQTRFHVFDPAGNILVYIDQDEASKYVWADYGSSELAQALENAVFLRDVYCTDEAAAKVLDKALAKYPSVASIDRARVLAARAELALALGDPETAQATRTELKNMMLSDEERDLYRDELEAPDTLEKWLIHKR